MRAEVALETTECRGLSRISEPPDTPALGTLGGGLRILLVDDDRVSLALLARMMSDLGFEVQCATRADQALEQLDTFRPNIVVTDLRMPDLDGGGLLHAVKRHNPSIPVIIASVVDSLEEVVSLLKQGADDYITKPVAHTLLATRLHQQVEKIAMKRDVEQLRSMVENAFDLGPDFLLGPSKAMLRLVAQIPSVAQSDAAVLIQGETGTGKELVARAIHRSSRRARGPLVSVNCASIPEGLWEREFFGHVRGAFTDAHDGAPGMIQSAHGGTLFLDEVGEIPIAAQAKLLRFLQDKEYRPVGSAQGRRADVRLISASNRDLRERGRDGRFRLDLYYRLEVIPLRVPALRERKEDIPHLAQHFLSKQVLASGKDVVGFSTLAMQKLCEHDYPGNVRELENVVQRAIVSTPVSVICPGAIRIASDLEDCDSSGWLAGCAVCALAAAPAVAAPVLSPGSASRAPRTDLPFREAKDLALAAFERQYVSAVLARYEGNASQAAKAMGLTRKSLARIRDRHNLGGPRCAPGRPRSSRP